MLQTFEDCSQTDQCRALIFVANESLVHKLPFEPRFILLGYVISSAIAAFVNDVRTGGKVYDFG